MFIFFLPKEKTLMSNLMLKNWNFQLNVADEIKYQPKNINFQLGLLLLKINKIVKQTKQSLNELDEILTREKWGKQSKTVKNILSLNS